MLGKGKDSLDSHAGEGNGFTRQSCWGREWIHFETRCTPESVLTTIA